MQKSTPENQPNVEEQTLEDKKYGDLNEGEEANLKFLDSSGQDISHLLNISHLKASDQTWDLLSIPEELKNNLISKGFKGPSRIQFQVLSLINNLNKSSEKSDIIAQSQNGSGKTLSFLIPALSCLTKGHAAKGSIQQPEVIILADTKELIYQIFKIVCLIKQDWAKVDYYTKDKPEAPDVNINILITTVDSCSMMISKNKVDLSSLKMFVIDEADKIILNDTGRKNLPTVLKSLRKDVRIGLFSATLPDKCITILQNLKRDYKRIVVENKSDLSLKNLMHYYVYCKRNEKFNFIDKFLNEVSTGSVIIFVSTKNFAETFGKRLNQAGHKTEILLGDMDLTDRVNILDEFKSGKHKVLISTNLLSRGIDARKVSVVINVDMPYTHKQVIEEGDKDRRGDIDLETYLHRCGRTARFGDMGLALNLIEDDRGLSDLKKIEKEYGIDMREISLDNFSAVIAKNTENNTFNKQKHNMNEENI